MTAGASLEIDGIGVRYGGLVALDAVSLRVAPGAVFGVIGPNGAGKSTLVGVLGGALRPSSGRLRFDGLDITRTGAADRARLGIGRTYQIPRPFLDLTVEENLEVAQLACRGPRRVRRDRRGEILRRCALAEFARAPARSLPLLRRKRLEFARALALDPRLLLLDEIGAGLVDAEIDALVALIRSVAAEGRTVVIVEHVLRIVRECCTGLAVLNFGAKLCEGTPAEVLSSDGVAAIYLGTAHVRGEAAAGGAERAPLEAQRSVSARVAGSRPPVSTLVAAESRSSGAGDGNWLSLERVSAYHGQLAALRDVSLRVGRGEVVAVLGPNGAGKTSLAAAVCGSLPIRSGAIRIDGVPIVRARPEQIAALGVAHCMEGRRIFADLSVEQNLLIAARGVGGDESRRRLAAVRALFPVLADRSRDPGTSMSGGEQQMLAIGRALMARPRLIVFDEISLGLAPIVVDRLYEALLELKRAGLSMLLVEQDVDRALALADRAYVLERGAVAIEGTASGVRTDGRLRHLYVGAAD